MGKKNFKPRHMRSTRTDRDGNEMIHHTVQVGPSSFIADKNPPDGGYCDNCGVEIDMRHYQDLIDRLTRSGVTILTLQKKIAEYEGDGGELAEEQAEADEKEEIEHLDDEADEVDEVGTPDPEPQSDDVVGSEF